MLNLPVIETEDRRQCNFIVKKIQQKTGSTSIILYTGFKSNLECFSNTNFILQ